MKSSRRDFLRNVSVGSGALLASPSSVIWANGFAPSRPIPTDKANETQTGEDFIKVKNSRKLGVDRLPVERVCLGLYYKPNLVRLLNDELRLIGEATQPTADMHGKNDHPIFRSTDGGRSWAQLVVPDLTGGEPYLVALKDGTLLMTGDIFVRSKGTEGRNLGYFVHRSEDGGQTWSNPETAAVPLAPGDVRVGSRNVLELADGSLLFVFGTRRSKDPKEVPEQFIWRSFDGGRTWPEKYPASIGEFPKGYPYCVLEEAFLWQARSGKLYAIARVGNPGKLYYPLPGRVLTERDLLSANISILNYGSVPVMDIADSYIDDLDHMKIFTSTDLGRTWQPGRDLGDYGQHYPSVLRLQDGRLLLTFTVRAMDPPLGVRAVLGTESEDGFQLDFEHDVIMIDTGTPIGRISGGGFGPTVQLKNGTLVTTYSYWPPEDKTPARDLGKSPAIRTCMVARWRLPAQMQR